MSDLRCPTCGGALTADVRCEPCSEVSRADQLRRSEEVGRTWGAPADPAAEFVADLRQAIGVAPTCETCHGHGWHAEETEESKKANDVYNYDYREAYCSCPAGERLRERDISILEYGREVACIWRERPAWPEAGGPSLVMRSDGLPAFEECRHGSLRCEMEGDPREVVPRPLVVCVDCDTKWRPSGL